MALPARAVARPRLASPDWVLAEYEELTTAIYQMTAVQLEKLRLIEERGPLHPSIPKLRADIAQIDRDVACAEASLRRLRPLAALA